LYPDPNDRPKQTPGLHFRGSGIPVLVTTTQELKRPALLDCTKGVSEAEAKKSQKAWATYLKGKGVNVDASGQRLVDLGGDVEMKLMLIPPGKFEMGSDAEDIKAYIKAIKDGGVDANEEWFEDEKPKHAVTISKGLLMGKFEVRQREYKQIMGNNPSRFTDDLDCPVETVTWFDAVAFCNKLSEKVGLKPCYKLKINKESGGSISEAEVEYLPTGTGFRLPTEAEWEYASRGGTKDAFYFGNVLNGKQANTNGDYPYGTSTKGPRLGKTSKVGAYEGVSPHPFGLCDTVGNVWEWCQDGYEEGFYAKSPVNDPVNDSVQKYRVLRGGSWFNYAHLCRCAFRCYCAPDYRFDINGFRVVLVLP
jgi:formylglycine-generating enzyme required for sulfatase activity